MILLILAKFYDISLCDSFIEGTPGSGSGLKKVGKDERMDVKARLLRTGWKSSTMEVILRFYCSMRVMAESE